MHLGDEKNTVACMVKAQTLASAQQAALGEFLARHDPEWSRQPEQTRLWAAGIDAFRNIYEFAHELHFWANNEARAAVEYDLILAQFEAALACWHRAAAAAGAASPISAAELKNLDRKLGIAAYNKGCILAKGGRTDEALAALRRAFEHDASLRANARMDADLAALRGDPDFIELTESPDAGLRCAGPFRVQIMSNTRML